MADSSTDNISHLITYIVSYEVSNFRTYELAYRIAKCISDRDSNDLTLRSTLTVTFAYPDCIPN